MKATVFPVVFLLDANDSLAVSWKLTKINILTKNKQKLIHLDCTFVPIVGAMINVGLKLELA